MGTICGVDVPLHQIIIRYVFRLNVLWVARAPSYAWRIRGSIFLKSAMGYGAAWMISNFFRSLVS